MSDPVLYVVAGPNGAGKTTFYVKVLGPVTRLAFVNVDLIAADLWPDAQVEHAYDAARLAADDRVQRIAARESFATKTVFSHESKVALLREAEQAGYRVVLHIILIPEDLAVARVTNRVANGGHDVPEYKVRARFDRLWRHLRDAIAVVDEAYVYDNTKAAEPFRRVASFINGLVVGTPQWPAWTPGDLRDAGR